MLAQLALLEFVRKTDPLSKAGAEITTSTIHNTDGDAYTAQRRLDIYNSARRQLLDELKANLPKDEFLKRASGFIISTGITFTAGAASKPTNYIMLTSDETGILLSNVYVRLRTNISANNPEYTQDAYTKYVQEVGTEFKDPLSTLAGTGTISYIGCTELTLANVTTATAIEEKFKENDIPRLVSIAVEIANKEATQ